MAATPPRFAAILPPDTRLVQRHLSLDGGQQVLALGLIAPFSLSPDPTTPPAPDPDIWAQAARLLGENMDSGWPKLQGELHIAGGWQAHPQQAAQITIQAPGNCLSVQLTQAQHAAGPFFVPQIDPQSPGVRYWAGGETIHLQSMHPQHPHLYGVVPSVQPRFFVHQTQPDGSHRFAELEASIDTLWLLPSLTQGLVIYRALAPTCSADGHGINAMLVALEPKDVPAHPTEHYLQHCVQAMAAPYAGDIALITPDIPLTEHPLHEEIRRQKLQFQAALAQHGLDDERVMQTLMANPHTQQFAQLIAQRAGNLSGFFNEIESLLHIIEHGDLPPSSGRHTP